MPEQFIRPHETEKNKIENGEEEKIVRGIIETKKIIESDKKFTKYELHYGSKCLLIRIDNVSNFFETYIEGIGDKKNKKPNETTLLYKSALILMQERAESTKSPANYLLQTSNEKMEK